MDKCEHQNKPCYLENRVVSELCKWRTACICFCHDIKKCHFLAGLIREPLSMGLSFREEGQPSKMDLKAATLKLFLNK
jgi:hypothetical protein